MIRESLTRLFKEEDLINFLKFIDPDQSKVIKIGIPGNIEEI